MLPYPLPANQHSGAPLPGTLLLMPRLYEQQQYVDTPIHHQPASSNPLVLGTVLLVGLNRHQLSSQSFSGHSLLCIEAALLKLRCRWQHQSCQLAPLAAACVQTCGVRVQLQHRHICELMQTDSLRKQHHVGQKRRQQLEPLLVVTETPCGPVNW